MAHNRWYMVHGEYTVMPNVHLTFGPRTNKYLLMSNSYKLDKLKLNVKVSILTELM